MCLSTEFLSPCRGRHLPWLHSHAVEVFLFFQLWEAQILQCTRDDLTSDCCQQAPLVSLLPPLHWVFRVLSQLCSSWGFRLKRVLFFCPSLNTVLLIIFPHACTEAINRREGLRHTYLQYLISRFLCQSLLPYGWLLVWPDLVFETSFSTFQVEFLMCCGLMDALNDQW